MKFFLFIILYLNLMICMGCGGSVTSFIEAAGRGSRQIEPEHQDLGSKTPTNESSYIDLSSGHAHLTAGDLYLNISAQNKSKTLVGNDLSLVLKMGHKQALLK